MAWSETMFIIQHFYNVFDINERLDNLEDKIPLVARSVNGRPENIIVEDLTPGTLWFIQSGEDESKITSLSILKEKNIFAEPIPFVVDMKNIVLENDIQQIASSMELTTQNYYDIIKSMLEILKALPDNYAKKNHASNTKEYGVGTEKDYGHIRITDSYDSKKEANDIALSTIGIGDILKHIHIYFFQVVNEEKLFSGCLSAYKTEDMADNTLHLVDDYFSIQPITNNRYTLIVK